MHLTLNQSLVDLNDSGSCRLIVFSHVKWMEKMSASKKTFWLLYNTFDGWCLNSLKVGRQN